MTTPPTVLSRIIEHTRHVIEERASETPLEQMRALAASASPVRGFKAALDARITQKCPGVIAEVKKGSPSKGIIRDDFAPGWIAERYEAGGAACLSVLTEPAFFHGSPEHLKQARAACTLPVLRKDFMIDLYQVYEARAMGADAILLIVAALDDATLAQLHDVATSLGMDVLVEVHNEEELTRALTLPVTLLGINNRNLHTFETTLDTTLALHHRVPEAVTLVTESGVLSAEDVSCLQSHGIHGFLVGEAFMRADDPGAQLHGMFFSS